LGAKFICVTFRGIFMRIKLLILALMLLCQSCATTGNGGGGLTEKQEQGLKEFFEALQKM